MAVDQLTQYGPMSGAFAAGATACWVFVNRFLVPSKIQGMQQEIDLLKAQVGALQEKAKKYDALNERLAQGALARLE